MVSGGSVALSVFLKPDHVHRHRSAFADDFDADTAGRYLCHFGAGACVYEVQNGAPRAAEPDGLVLALAAQKQKFFGCIYSPRQEEIFEPPVWMLLDSPSCRSKRSNQRLVVTRTVTHGGSSICAR